MRKAAERVARVWTLEIVERREIEPVRGGETPHLTGIRVNGTAAVRPGCVDAEPAVQTEEAAAANAQCAGLGRGARSTANEGRVTCGEEAGLAEIGGAGAS